MSSHPNIIALEARVHLAFCGKHPTAADHMEDLGLVTSRLATFHRQFYVESLASCVARSVWSEELPAGTPPRYEHHILNIGPDGWVAGQFTESIDATGRQMYPFIACLHGKVPGQLQAAPTLWPWLDKQLRQARAAESASGLRELHNRAQGELEFLSRQWRSAPAPSAGERQRSAITPEGVERLAHAILGQGPRADRLRVPLRGGEAAHLDAILWASLLRRFFPNRPVTLVWPRAGEFADLIQADPEPGLLYALFSDSAKAPLATSIPFRIPPETQQRAQTGLEAWVNSPELFPAAVPANKPAGGSFIKRLTNLFSSGN
jgi:hypothetical protein